MTDRIACCIPACRRTFKAEAAGDAREIMCGRHWRMADQRLRERHKRMRKRDRKIGRLLQRKVIQQRRQGRLRPLFALFVRLENSAWEAIKTDVMIKAAMGAEDAPGRRGTL